jgi:transcriptional regulator with XRE-family HTH domain
MSDTLTAQLSRKVAAFLNATGLTQKQLARYIGCDRSQLTSYLSTGRGLSAERSLRLMQVLNSSRSQLEAKFGRKAVSSRILELQERGKAMKLDRSGSWVPGGTDPNGTDDVTGVKTARDLDNSVDYQAKITAFLKAQQSIYRQAIAHIDNYLANVQKSKVNKDGVTDAPRKANTNTVSSTPGPRGDLLSDPDKLREHLAFVKREREKAEETVKLQRQLEKERELMWAARVEARKKESKAH